MINYREVYKLKYIFIAHMKKCKYFTVLYDEFGKIFRVNREASDIFEKFLTPRSVDDQIFNNIDKSKLQELIIWGIKKQILGVYKNQITKEDLKIYNTPDSVAIYNTYRCNQKCKFCYTNSGPCSKIDKKILDTKSWESVIDKLISEKILSITLLGGEPFLDSNFVLNVLEKSKGKIFVRIFTNGTANGGISKSLARKLSLYKNYEIIFSIHSHIAEEHDEVVGCKGAFEKLLVSAGNMIKYTDILVSASTAVTKSNVSKIKNISELLENHGFNSYDIKPFSPSKRVENFMDYFPSPLEMEKSIEETRDYLSDKNLYFSYALRHASNISTIPEIEFWGEVQPQIGGCISDNEANIDPYGYVYRCPFVLSNEKYRIFNILEGNFSEYWDKYVWKYARTKQQVQEKACLECTWLDKCHGGCSYLSETFFSESSCGDPYCPKVYYSRNIKRI